MPPPNNHSSSELIFLIERSVRRDHHTRQARTLSPAGKPKCIALDKAQRLEMKNPFNSPFEAGIRAVTILAAAYPSTFDMQRLVIFDYLIVHSGDAEGPVSLHPPIPLRSGELLVRRDLVERGLMLMLSRGLVDRHFLHDGVFFSATEDSAPFVATLTSDYIIQLEERAAWAVELFGQLTNVEINGRARQLIKSWAPEFEGYHEPGALF